MWDLVERGGACKHGKRGCTAWGAEGSGAGRDGHSHTRDEIYNQARQCRRHACFRFASPGPPQSNPTALYREYVDLLSPRVLLFRLMHAETKDPVMEL